MDNKNTIQTILNYLRGRFSNKERYDFEKELTKDPFLEAAMDGFTRLSPDELENDFTLLNTRLEKRIQKPASRKLIPYLSIAAGIAIILGVGSIVLYKSFSPVSNKEVAQTIDVTKGLDSLQRRPINSEQSQRIIDELSKENSEEQMAQSLSSKKQKNEIEIMMADEESQAVTDQVELDFAEAEPKSLPLELSDAADTGKSSVRNFPAKQELAILIKGMVVDADTKEPLPGANIISDSKRGTLTDANGIFEFKIIEDSLLKIAYVGYETQVVKITDLVNNNQQIELKAENLALDEVVVIGYGTQKKQQVTGSISRIESSEISGIPERVAGVSVSKSKAAKHNKPNWVTLHYEDDVDEHCKPKDGIKNFEKYLKKNVQIKPENIETVMLEITIESDGTFDEPLVLESTNDIFADEALRLIKEGPYWLPATLNEVNVNETLTITITFQ